MGECGYGSIGGPDPELGTGEGNKGLIELAGIRRGTHFPFSFLMLVLCSWEDQENIRGKNLMLVSAVNPTLIVYHYVSIHQHESCERKKHNVCRPICLTTTCSYPKMSFWDPEDVFAPAGRIGSKEECGSG